MQKTKVLFLAMAVGAFTITACQEQISDLPGNDNIDPTPAVTREFGDNIDLNNLENYANQTVPAYIRKDNTNGNVITNAKATLGRVLFYDKKLSNDNTISCASCHQQKFAFSDVATVSTGVAGTTGRHGMRLINARFGTEDSFFWDERAATLEIQTTQPIQDHVEMGFSGQNGDPGFSDLITKLEGTDYYQELFNFVYGDTDVTEARMQECMAQFIRSIQSFDSKYDEGRVAVANDRQDFTNFTQVENLGKALFLDTPGNGGAGCGGCHRAPEFDIDPNSRNNGVTSVVNSTSTDVTVTRSPSLRDLVNNEGTLNGPLMHDGSLTTLLAVVNHYNRINPTGNTNLDPRLSGGPANTGQNLQLTDNEKTAIVAFLGTLTGNSVYTDEKWSDPFQ